MKPTPLVPFAAVPAALAMLSACANASPDRSVGVWAGDIKLCRETVLATRRALNWQDQSPVLKVRLQESAAHRFAELTGSQIGKTMEFRLHGRVFMAPIIAEQVTGGSLDLVGLTEGDMSDVLAQVKAPC